MVRWPNWTGLLVQNFGTHDFKNSEVKMKSAKPFIYLNYLFYLTLSVLHFFNFSSKIFSPLSVTIALR